MKTRATIFVLGFALAAMPAVAQSFQKNFSVVVTPPTPTVTNITCGTGVGSLMTVNIPAGQTALAAGTVICPMGVTMSDGSAFAGKVSTLDCTASGTGCVAGTKFVVSSATLPSNVMVGTTALAPGTYFVQFQAQ